MKSYLAVIFVLVFGSSFCQTDFCECCSYHSLQFKYTEYEKIFPPELIKKNGYRELMVLASGRLRDDTVKTNTIKIRKTLIPEHKEIKFYFNEAGYVTYMTHYNRMGKPHSTYKFDRNAAGKLIKLTFAYIDSLEKILPILGLQTTIYTYDNKNNLVKEKELNDGQELSDERSKYSKYTYDQKNRIVQRTDYSYYDEKSVYNYVTTIKYSDNSFSAESTTKQNGKEWLNRSHSYNSEWMLTGEKTFYNKKISSEEILKYNSDKQLESYWRKQGGAGECPESNGFLDLYFYNNKKLVERITHNFNNYTCEMTFEYR